MILHLGTKPGAGPAAKCGKTIHTDQFTSLAFARKVAAGHKPPDTEICQECWRKVQNEDTGT